MKAHLAGALRDLLLLFERTEAGYPVPTETREKAKENAQKALSDYKESVQ